MNNRTQSAEEMWYLKMALTSKLSQFTNKILNMMEEIAETEEHMIIIKEARKDHMTPRIRTE